MEKRGPLFDQEFMPGSFIRCDKGLFLRSHCFAVLTETPRPVIAHSDAHACQSLCPPKCFYADPCLVIRIHTQVLNATTAFSTLRQPRSDGNGL